jgi:hypothetical protein
MRRIVTTFACLLAMSAVVPAFAASNPNPSGHGLPSVSCENFTTAQPPGFSMPGFGTAEDHYNPISQYDVACYQLSSR